MLCASTGRTDEGVAFTCRGEWKGLPVVQPMTPMILAVERQEDAPVLAKGEVMTCKPFQRHVKVVEVGGATAVIHETVLDCKGKKYAVRGIGFE